MPPWLLPLRGCCGYAWVQLCRPTQLGVCCWLLWRSGSELFCSGLLRGWQQRAPLTRLAICLQATAIDEMTVASSLSRCPAASSCGF